MLGWAVPFIWAGIWAAITLPWVRAMMAKERKSWEEDSTIAGEMRKDSAPGADAPGPLAEKASESSTLRGSLTAGQDEDTDGKKLVTSTDEGGSLPRPTARTTL